LARAIKFQHLYLFEVPYLPITSFCILNPL
jgi:hypothetical protein